MHSLVRAYALLLACNGVMLRAYALLLPYLALCYSLCLVGTTYIELISVSLHCITVDLVLNYVDDECVCEVLGEIVNFVHCVNYYPLACDIHRIFIECNSHLFSIVVSMFLEQ